LVETSPGTWTCPGAPYGAVECAGGETYELLTDAVHLAAALDVLAVTAAEFDEAPPTRPVLFFWGELPQHIVWEGKSEIYLERAAFGHERFFWQVAHEGFHHVCTPPAVLHWSHEMLATLWSWRFMDASGRHTFSQAVAQREISRIDLCPLDMMFAVNSLPYPDGFYGRALSVGFELQEEVGWPLLKSLAYSFDSKGRPDVDAWRAALPEETVPEVTRILSP
jgi:hypothetical protein